MNEVRKAELDAQAAIIIAMLTDSAVSVDAMSEFSACLEKNVHGDNIEKEERAYLVDVVTEATLQAMGEDEDPITALFRTLIQGVGEGTSARLRGDS